MSEMVQTAFTRSIGVIEEGMAAGLHVGAQFYVSRKGRVLADLAFGSAGNGAAMTTHTVMMWMSAGKPLAAVAFGQLWQEGLLEIDDPVARFIPEFAAHGKEGITLRHLLTHTAGIRWIDTGWPDEPWDRIIERIAGMRLEPGWVPGEKAGYHVVTSWFLLGEVIARLGKMPYARYIRERVFKPAGMTDSHIALSEGEYAAYGDRMGVMQNTQAHPVRPASFDTPRHAAAASPGSTARGPIRELARLYEIMLDHGRLSAGGARLLDSTTVEALTSRHRTGLYDHTFKTVVDWGLGFIVNSQFYGDENLPYGYGPHASRRTFGHSGSQSSFAFADPVRDIVAAAVFNGMPGDAVHNQRQRALCAAIYEDLGDF